MGQMEEKLLPSSPTAVGCEIQVVLEAGLVGEGLCVKSFIQWTRP